MFHPIPCQDSPAPRVHILPPSDSNMHPGISLKGFARVIMVPNQSSLI